MSKILMLCDGREFSVVVCPFTEEQKSQLADLCLFDDVIEMELVGELPKIKPATYEAGQELSDDQRFTMFIKLPKASGEMQAKIKLGYDDGTATDADGFEQGASGTSEEIIDDAAALQSLIDDNADS